MVLVADPPLRFLELELLMLGVGDALPDSIDPFPDGDAYFTSGMSSQSESTSLLLPFVLMDNLDTVCMLYVREQNSNQESESSVLTVI